SVRPEPGSNSPTKTLSNSHPDNKQMLPKESETEQTKQACPARGINNWHWLYKHPVEFSKNNHTPTKPPH
ncbi:hypothetical protein, partial [Micromonospora wenchangensis]|uniref:hypothetical protein n=1 Tax=Micromonospora wenchangensis TaxID=1185415 RepID=UPI003423AF65